MIAERLNTAINDQIKHELESYYIYLSMAAYFHTMSLDGMGHWMRCQAHEETIHAMKFFEHLIDRDGKVVLQDLKQLKPSGVHRLRLSRMPSSMKNLSAAKSMT